MSNHNVSDPLRHWWKFLLLAAAFVCVYYFTGCGAAADVQREAVAKESMPKADTVREDATEGLPPMDSLGRP